MPPSFTSLHLGLFGESLSHIRGSVTFSAVFHCTKNRLPSLFEFYRGCATLPSSNRWHISARVLFVPTRVVLQWAHFDIQRRSLRKEQAYFYHYLSQSILPPRRYNRRLDNVAIRTRNPAETEKIKFEQSTMFRTVLIILVLLLPAIASGATVLLLKNGGVLEGELLNPNEVSRKSYRIKMAGGFEIHLDAKLVEREQNRERPALVKYNSEVYLTENTVENHLYWARWCNENQLLDQAKLHRQQILELEPDHAETRQILGYEKTQDGWVSLRERRETQGFIQDRGGRWRTAQQIEVANILESQKKEEDQWRRTLRDLIRRLPNSEAELLAIRDPSAIEPLKDVLTNERNPFIRKVLLRALVQIPRASAVRFVVRWSILDTESDEIRQTCIDELLRTSKDNPEVRQIMIESYRLVLRPTVTTSIITLAAKALEDIGAREAVPELIDVLVVTRVETIQSQPQPYSFGSGGTSLGQGSKTINNPVLVPNHSVLKALVTLTGKNFQFDQAMWREWYRQTQRSPSLNLRRD